MPLPALTSHQHSHTTHSQEWFGVATGEMLHSYSQGVDSTLLESVPDRKSIGVEVNWGIRFTDKSKAMRFFSFVCAELASRIDQVEELSTLTLASTLIRFRACLKCISITLPCSITTYSYIIFIAVVLYFIIVYHTVNYRQP